MEKRSVDIVAVFDAEQVGNQSAWQQLPPTVAVVQIPASESNLNRALELRSEKHQLLLTGIERLNEAMWQSIIEQVIQHNFVIELNALSPAFRKLLPRIPAANRMLSWQGKTNSYACFEKPIQTLFDISAQCYKVVLETENAEQVFYPLRLLKALSQKNVIAFAKGEAHRWTQLVALQWGAPCIFGLSGKDAKQMHFSLQRLLTDFNLPEVRQIENIYGIVGSDTSQSRSPRMHNATYRQLNLPSLYLPFNVADFQTFWQQTVQSNTWNQLGLTVRGFTTVSPHKKAACMVADKLANKCALTMQSCNVMFKEQSTWVGSTTDAYGVLYALKSKGCNLKKVHVAILGCGGAGRSIACGLKLEGVKLTLINRTAARGQAVAEELNLPFLELDHFDPQAYDVVINATPVGKNEAELPFNPVAMKRGSLIIDMAYNTKETSLMQVGRACGLQTFSGRDMLVAQVREQFWLMTGHQMPLALANEIAGAEPTITRKSEKIKEIKTINTQPRIRATVS